MADFNQHFLEKCAVASDFVAVGSLATAANTGFDASLVGFGRCAVIITKAAGATSANSALTMLQSTGPGSTATKALNFTRYDYLIPGSTSSNQPTNFTQVSSTAINTLTLGHSTSPLILVIDFKQEDLDIGNNYTTINCSVTQSSSTNAEPAAAVYVLHDPRYDTGTGSSSPIFAAPPVTV